MSANAPPDLADGWTVSSPQAQGLDGEVLAGLQPQFEAWTDANLHAALIVRNGVLVYERYFEGEDQRFGRPIGRIAYDASMRHDVRSITKSVTSLLVGIGLDRGWIESVETPVFEFFPEHADLRTPEKDRITLRHLLTMTPGLAWNEDVPYSDPTNSERRMIDAADQCRFVLERPLVRPPGVAYIYNGGTTALLAEVLKRASGLPVDEIARRELFDPLGVGEVEWMRYADGTPMAASGLVMRPRDLAKIGQMVLEKGIGTGGRIVSQNWITESTAPQVNGQGLFFYGYQWWLGRSLINRREIKWIAGYGWGCQRLFVVPDFALVVVVHAGLYSNPFLQPVVGEVVLRRYALAAAAGTRAAASSPIEAAL